MPVWLLLRAVMHCLRTSSAVAFDLVRLAFLSVRFHKSLAAENLFLRKQLALFQERKLKPRRANDATRWSMATLSRMFQWRSALVNVKPDTLIRWQRREFRLFWRRKSKPTGPPRLPKNLRELIRKDHEKPLRARANVGFRFAVHKERSGDIEEVEEAVARYDAAAAEDAVTRVQGAEREVFGCAPYLISVISLNHRVGT